MRFYIPTVVRHRCNVWFVLGFPLFLISFFFCFFYSVLLYASLFLGCVSNVDTKELCGEYQYFGVLEWQRIEFSSQTNIFIWIDLVFTGRQYVNLMCMLSVLISMSMHSKKKKKVYFWVFLVIFVVNLIFPCFQSSVWFVSLQKMYKSVLPHFSVHQTTLPTTWGNMKVFWPP